MLLDSVRLALLSLLGLFAAQLVGAQDSADQSPEKAGTYTLPIAVKPVEGMSYANAVVIGIPLGILVDNVDKRMEKSPEPETAPSN